MRILTEEEVVTKPTEEIKTTQGLGWNGRRPDKRDWTYEDDFITKLGSPKVRSIFQSVLNGEDESLPDRHSLKQLSKYMPVMDQQDIGSCTGCSWAYLFQWERRVVPRSVLQLYYEIRRRQGWQDIDSGGYIRDGAMVLRQLGSGRASWWPYDTSKFREDPPLKVDRDALRRKLFDAYWLQNANGTGNEYRHCLTTNHPFVIGFTVFSGFMRQRVAQFGIYNYPDLRREYVLGGHAVVVVGYDNKFRESEWAKDAVARGYPAHLVPEQVFIIRNSWGEGWGSRGEVAMDASFLSDLGFADDAWTGRNFKAPSTGGA